MKKLMIIISICLSLFAALPLAGCSNNKDNVNKGSTTKEITNPEIKAFTLEELKEYNGEKGKPAYVAVDGIVYDVTNVEAWTNGKHQNYNAGVDLTNEIVSSPHGKDILKDVPIVGKIEP
ncbi:MAG: cytochrome b5 domain-containing protein [Clostridiaceae bacterium]